MDKAVSLLISLGYSTKEIHGTKAKHKVKMLAKHYGYKVPLLKRDIARELLHEFVELETQNKDTFRLLFDKYFMRQMVESGQYHQKLDEHQLTIVNLPGSKFYQTPEWRELRYKVLANSGNKCCACGKSPKDGVIIHVDHILPRSIFPEHALTFSNLQVLCEDCNIGKSNKDSTDWRKR